MIVSQAEIDLIKRARRTMMRLPAEITEKEPVKYGHAYRLQPAPFARGQFTITVVEVRREKLAALNEDDAKREGYYSVAGALRAWEPLSDRLVWVIGFVRGNHAKFMAQDNAHLLIARSGSSLGEYTDRPEKAMPNESEAVREDLLKRFTAAVRQQEREHTGAPRAERDRQRERRQARSRAESGSVHPAV